MPNDIHIILSVLNQPDVLAIVLGGSYCVGLQNDTSDIDICIYYDSDINIRRLNTALSYIDDDHASSILLPLNTWGIWQNSGGVCLVNGKEYDIALRNISFMEQIVNETILGNIYCIHNPAYPFGYCNSYLIGEIDNCHILYSVSDKLSGLKQKILVNKNNICQSIIQFFLEDAIFQCICSFKAEFACDLPYRNAAIKNCAFSLLNVYAAQKNILLFHNKKVNKRILSAYCTDELSSLPDNVQFILDVFSSGLDNIEKTCHSVGRLIICEVESNLTTLKTPANYALLKTLINQN